jgi:AcrR family transcriptional regulator
VTARTVTRYLDRETLVRTAADLADSDGWSALTLSQVAKEVDRHVSSLYAHVDGLAALRKAVALVSFGELSDLVWRAALGKVKGDALQAIADVYRHFAIDHPGRTASLTAERHRGDPELSAAGLHLAEPVRATLRSFGLTEPQVAVAHQVFSATVVGFARAGGGEDEFHQAVALFVLGLSSGGWPVV